MEYRNVSGHPDDDADGRIFERDGFLEFDEEQLENPVNQAKIAQGLWIKVPVREETGRSTPSRSELMAQARDFEIEGRSNMTNDELATAIIVAQREQTTEATG